MESASTILGAFSAGKLPSQKQTNEWIDFVVRQLDSWVEVPKSSGSAKLSERGSMLIRDMKQFLLAYKELGSHKNGDDQFQEALWNLSNGQIKLHPSMEDTHSEALNDAEQASIAFQNMLNIFWRRITGRDGGAADFASFTRTLVADTAEVVEQHAGTIKEKMRETQAEVEEGKRDPLTGLPRAEGEPQDTKEKFERRMDALKMAGAGTIGAGQQAQESGAELRDKTGQNFDSLLDSVLSHAERDPEYRDAVTGVFDIISKWFNRSLDNVDRTSIDEIVHDPSGRVPNALKCINKLLERLAGGKSTATLKDRFRLVLIDIRDDPELRRYFDDVHDFSRRTLQEPNYVRSQEHEQRRQELRQRWQELQSGEDRRKWHDDTERLQAEANDFFGRIQNDNDVKRLQEASVVFGNDITEAVKDLTMAATGNANWLWQDVVDVVLPRIIDSLKGVPIPRTEYKDSEVAFVIENLQIESFSLLPGQAHIRNTTDVNLSKPSAGSDTETKFSSRTQIHFKGVQLKLNDVSFWYEDVNLKPIKNISGLMGINIPPQGLDVDIILGLRPQPSAKAQSPQNQHAFFNVERVLVDLNDPTFNIRKSNHPILFTAFKPLVRSRLETTVQNAIKEHITTMLQVVDAIAYDIYSRAGVFRDSGLSTNASYIGALWSEIGHLRSQPGLFSGLKTTSVGIVKDDPRQDAKFAMGAEPQIIPGEKHGPDVGGMQEKREQGAKKAREVKEGTTTGVPTDKSVVTSFADQMRMKKEQEEQSQGWRSNAFDMPFNKSVSASL
jgi:hypothetical protein